ncbi:esterase/lipase family protein [Mycobacterium celatum]|uniref:Alpha/beta hydrolase n=1 Tax=Mycobacterium celatum TaxID=28045 RepID=A0A1X1RHI8_MYCCE|nr:alpha/beta hydrolase [Mycobacterium celatum]ORV06374.1 alpha/beta hydrolase [Mycobacterium celatum]PIB78797.1 alpha/beta hydrolase [Mycobacterium celatum]
MEPVFQPVERPRRSGGPPWHLALTDPGRAAVEFGLLLGALPLRRALPVGDGHPVLVLPGLLAGDGSTLALRRILRGLGYRMHGWRLGRNIGPTAQAVAGMGERLHDLHTRYGTPVSVIGWSLGGIYARGMARRRPSSVRQVITLGTPFRLADRNQTRASAAFNRFSHLHVERARAPVDLETEPLPVPATSIYSRYDGVVAWQACLDLRSPQAENISVIGSHFGYGHNPAVLWAIADRLAQPRGEWAPFRPPATLRPLFPRPDWPPDRSAASGSRARFA